MAEDPQHSTTEAVSAAPQANATDHAAQEQEEEAPQEDRITRIFRAVLSSEDKFMKGWEFLEDKLRNCRGHCHALSQSPSCPPTLCLAPYSYARAVITPHSPSRLSSSVLVAWLRAAASPSVRWGVH